MAPLLLGSGNKHADYAYVKGGEAVLIAIGEGGELRPAGSLKLGGLPEGVAFNPRGDYVYIGNYIDQNLQTFRIDGGKLVEVGSPMKLPGQPASMRGPVR